MDEILDNTQFNAFVKEIKQKIYSAKSKAILSANKLMTELWDLLPKFRDNMIKVKHKGRI